MWAEIGKILLSIGAVGIIAALSAKLAKKTEELKAERRGKEDDAKADKIIYTNSSLDRNECLERLRGCTGKK